MLLALRIVAVVYAVAIAAFGIICRGAFRQPSDTAGLPESLSNVIPFERGSSLSGRAEVPSRRPVQS